MYAREADMAWKQGGHPTVQKQRDKWVVRVDGLDTETGRRRPRQIGTYSSVPRCGDVLIVHADDVEESS
jgi:hypothetical protein